MRSGTNWTASVLNLHPQINCQGEGPFGHFRTAVDVTTRSKELYASTEPFRTIIEEGFSELVRRTVLALADRKPYAQWVGDNTSRQLWPYVPAAHHFYVLRDGRDVLTSWTFHQARIGAPQPEPFRSELLALKERLDRSPKYFDEHPEELFARCERWVRHSAAVWRDFVLTGEHVLERVRRGLMDARVHVVRYESLLSDYERERSEMYRFLELDPAQAESPAKVPRSEPGYSESSTKSFFRQGKAGDWKKYATDEFREWFQAGAGDALVRAGYEKNESW
jgi:hypothetical protein